MLILAVAALLAWPLLVFGGVSAWGAAPLVPGAVLLALAVRPAVARHGTRWLDTALITLVAGIAIQLVPLGPAIVDWIEPDASRAYSVLLLDAGTAHSRPLSMNPRATLEALCIAGSAVLLFWSCRELLAQGGVRKLTRAILGLGLMTAFVAIAQRATSPGLIYWHWQPLDSTARPFGPFVNRNHFATWLLMALPLSFGYFIAHLRSRRREGHSRGRPAALVEQFDQRAIWVPTAGLIMALALMLSLSRSGLAGLAVALIAGAWLTRRELERGERVWAVGAILAGTVLVASYADLNAVMYRFDQTLASGYADRHVIWRETLPILRSFWMSGTGAGTFPTAMLAYQRSDRTFFFNQAHNHYLQLATEGGLLLGIPVISSLAALLLSARRRLTLDRTAVYWVRAGAVAGLAAVACQSIWETGLRMPANAVLCAILAAVAVHERHPAEFERGAS